MSIKRCGAAQVRPWNAQATKPRQVGGCPPATLRLSQRCGSSAFKVGQPGGKEGPPHRTAGPTRPAHNTAGSAADETLDTKQADNTAAQGALSARRAAALSCAVLWGAAAAAADRPPLLLLA